PLYKRPSTKTVVRRMLESAWAFVYRAGTLILASMILVWAALYFPSKDYVERIEQMQPVPHEARRLEAEWKQQSVLGRLGQAIEPAVRPLGWDWRIGVAALASFPAREVVVGTLGILYRQGKVEADDIREASWAEVGETGLGRALREATWDGTDRPVFTIPAVL